jgi:hypothetical protein
LAAVLPGAPSGDVPPVLRLSKAEATGRVGVRTIGQAQKIRNHQSKIVTQKSSRPRAHEQVSHERDHCE